MRLWLSEAGRGPRGRSARAFLARQCRARVCRGGCSCALVAVPLHLSPHLWLPFASAAHGRCSSRDLQEAELAVSFAPGFQGDCPLKATELCAVRGGAVCYVTCAPTKLFCSRRVSAGWAVMSCCPPCCVPGSQAALSQPGPFPMAGCGWGDRAAAPGLTSAAAAGSVQPVPQQSPEASV